MLLLRILVLATACVAPLAAHAGGAAKKVDKTWAKIVVAFVPAAFSAKAAVEEKTAFGTPDSEVNLDVKFLGGEGKFSMKAIKAKFGAPTKTEKFDVKEGAKVIKLQQLYYGPISFTIVAGSDQPRTISLPRKLWGGKGVLENAKEALATK